MTEETESRIPCNELTRVSFQCKQCAAEITVDVSKKEHFSVEATGHPMKCPVCGTEFDSRLRGAFTKLFEWREDVKQSGHTVYFRIKRG